MARNGYAIRDIKYDAFIRFSHIALNKSIRRIAREMNVSRWHVTKAIKGSG